jgi:hypothetical protein
MSLIRQVPRTDARDPDGFPVRGLAVTYGDRSRLDRHTHPWAQLVYAASGVMVVSTPDASWIVPPTRAIWVPGGVPHEILMRGSVAMRTLYLAPSEADARLSACRAIEVAPLLRELILHIVRQGMLEVDNPAHARLEALLLDLLAAGETAPLELPLPRDPRARAFAERLMAQPGDPAALADLARGSGASLRTLQRLFLAETGLPLESWRGPVTAAALDAEGASERGEVAGRLTESSRALARRLTPSSSVASALEKHRRTMLVTGWAS